VAGELAKRGRPIRAVNAGVSGDTTAGGLRRADWVLSQRPDVIVLALGANDGLRGLPLEETDRNLRGIVAKARQAGARVLLCGMLIPTSYGPQYREGFGRLFPRLAREQGLPLVPFLLEGVAGRKELNLEDGIHPNPEGQRILAANVLPALEAILASPAPGGR
jgi:acyl-CoA thioesterase-1